MFYTDGLCYSVVFFIFCFILQYDSLSEIQRSFDEKSQTQEEVRKRYSSQVLRDNLQVAVMQSEEEAEATAEKLLSGV